MLISGFAAGPWGTNCWIAASAKGQECVIVDPGLDSIEILKSRLEANSLKPVAVLLTHGHIDHMWSVTPIADGYEIPALIHESDRHLLADPLAGVGPQSVALVEQLKAEFVEPAKLQILREAVEIEIAGLRFRVVPSPGHTEGSVMFELISEQPRIFSGDVLFKGSIGRTDLPGGDHTKMLQTLQQKVLTLAPETIVHCGHGPDTLIQNEIKSNPYLKALQGN
ncbi:MAG: hypothetical protein RL038_310 [Actinomycetota bacterium]